MSFRPGLIFGAVFIICILMIMVLPMAAMANPGSQIVQASDGAQQAAAVLDPAVAVQLLPTAPPVEPTVIPLPQEQPVQAAAVAMANPPEDAQLAEFIASVHNGQAGTLTGLYVPGLLALRVVEQPAGNDTFVSSEEGTVTRYGLPASAGVMALLAHNFLSGRDFIKIPQGQQIYLVFGDGQISSYKVSGIEFYQAHSPNDPYSDFTNLNGPGGETLSYQQLYQHIYTTSGRLVLQTCLEANGDLSWGRTFIIAEPG